MRLGAFWIAILVAVAPSVRAEPEQALPVDEDAIVAEIESLIDATPDPDEKARETARRLTRKGIKAHDSKQFDKAIELYGQALAADPLEDSIYYELAFTYSRIGDQPKALDAVIRALTLNPKAEIYHILKANTLDDLGFQQQSIDTYREFLEIQPDSFLGHLNLGITHSRNGEWEQAEAAFLRAAEIDPEHPSSYFNASIVCNKQGYDYDEQKYLEEYLEVAGKDPRHQNAEERLEELQQFHLTVDSEHPFPDLELVEKMTRVAWQSELHRKTFPDARGYELTFEEDKDVYTTVLPMWRETKQSRPEATFGSYDLWLVIDDAGYLDEYIWYHRQRAFGEQAVEWMDQHADRIEAFLDWAESEGLISEKKPAEPTQLERFRALPADLLEAVDASGVLYEIGSEDEKPDGMIQAERGRYARELKLEGEDRVACRKAFRDFDEEIPRSGAAALVPIFRCFGPGDSEYETGVRRAASLGLEIREIEFRPVGHVTLGEEVQVGVESTWLFYALAKAAWRKEPELRQRYGGSADEDRASLVEETFALAVAAGAYANDLEPDDPETTDEQTVPPDPVPALDRLLTAIESDDLRGFLLYEVIHKTYGIPLDRLEEQDAERVSEYLFEHVIFRTKVE